MSFRIDAKGKRYTNVVSKTPLQTVIQTANQRIVGFVHLKKGERLIDELNKQDQFIAVTDAEIFSISTEKIFNSNFLVVNRDMVIWIMPEEEIIQEEKLPGVEI
jgi:hypothetical protein